MMPDWARVWVWLRRGLPAVLALAGLAFVSPQPQTTLTTYAPHVGVPANIPNFVNPSAGCAWVGVGGQIFTQGGQPANGLIVNVTGTLAGRTINSSAVTGSALQFGPGGYEIVLGNTPATSSDLRLRLYDNANRPLSGSVMVRLVNSCQANLAVINLRQTTYTRFLYIPLAIR